MNAAYGLTISTCEYCKKCNGDDFDDESERYDYYTCGLKNELDMKEYGSYGSKDNEVLKEECLYPCCGSCAFKEEFKTIVDKRLKEMESK